MSGLLRLLRYYCQMVNQHYYSRYQKFIASLQGQRIDGYYELHHIVPRSLGGNDNKSNLVALTARQHYVAHWMLARAMGGSAARAFFMMSNFGRYGSVNSTTYEKARKEYSKLVSIQMQNREPYVVTEETRQLMREAKLGNKLSPEHIEKMRQSRIGKPLSDEWKANLSKAKSGIATRGSGWKQSEETKRKIIESNLNRPMVTCPHCQQTMKDHGGAKRWHFDRCKERKEAA